MIARAALLSSTATAIVLAVPLLAAEHRVVGLSASGKPIEALVVAAAPPTAPTVMLIGGLTGDGESGQMIAAEVEDLESNPPSRRRFHLLAIPLANPDKSPLVFPPTGVAYRENAESHALWRWIGLQAPDLVLIVGTGDLGLAQALSTNAVAGVGRVPARVIITARPTTLLSLPRDIPPSEAHVEINRRRARSPQQLAEELGRYFGHDFNQLTYIPGMALIAQMRLGHVSEVEKLAEPYLDPARNILNRANSLTLAGHLVFAELAERGNPQYSELVRNAADLGFSKSGEMLESMPFHDEMSDSVFMATPIVVKAGKLTGERRYFDLAARHFAFMQKLVQREDGLYRHSPLTEAAWGRGNAFPALGLALVLSDFPKDHPAYQRMMAEFQRHMFVLARFQDEDGLWREVIDQPGSYSETSATAMIGLAMERGIRKGWLDPAAYQPRVERAWRAVLARVGNDGQLVDVCESTNKQKTLEDYLHRAAILGADPRGGAMAMLFATEMADLH
ncbi:MAG: glycoside hydrolase family 88 protein [Acidobacteriia bacterium]|nr:glycoside hydrolase family 88 protein [Terriglobia bacterium]